MADEQTKRVWESLAWLEIESALAILSKKVPDLSHVRVDIGMIHAVSSMKTGIRPFGFKWSKTDCGICEGIMIPNYILCNRFASKQAAWLIAGFLHAALRLGRQGPNKWKKICRAGGIAGFLFPKIRQAISINRLEPSALLIIAAAGKLEWTRLRVPGIHHWTARVRHKDIEEAKWLGETAKTAQKEVKRQRIKGTQIFEMAIEQAIDECKTMAGHLKKTDKYGECIGLSSSLESYLREMRSTKHAKRPSKMRSKAESKIWSMIDAGKTTQPDAMDTLDLVEESLKEMMRTTQPD
ncbi:MAG: hypothetical protein AABX47_06495 [Nanoarchaeota archaeon]